MENSDKISKTIQAVAEKFKASKTKTKYKVVEDAIKAADKDLPKDQQRVTFKAGTILELTPSGYEGITRKFKDGHPNSKGESKVKLEKVK